MNNKSRVITFLLILLNNVIFMNSKYNLDFSIDNIKKIVEANNQSSRKSS